MSDSESNTPPPRKRLRVASGGHLKYHITHFSSPLASFSLLSGALKRIPQDFMVQEINDDGEVARIEDSKGGRATGEARRERAVGGNAGIRLEGGGGDEGGGGEEGGGMHSKSGDVGKPEGGGGDGGRGGEEGGGMDSKSGDVEQREKGEKVAGGGGGEEGGGMDFRSGDLGNREGGEEAAAGDGVKIKSMKGNAEGVNAMSSIANRGEGGDGMVKGGGGKDGMQIEARTANDKSGGTVVVSKVEDGMGKVDAVADVDAAVAHSTIPAPTSSRAAPAHPDESISDTMEKFAKETTTLGLKLPACDLEAIQAVAESDVRNKTKRELSIIIESKSLRGLLHQSIRKYFAKSISTSTLNDAKHTFVVERASASSMRRDNVRLTQGGLEPIRASGAFEGKPRDVPCDVMFVLKKTNVDSNHALSELSRVTRIPRKCFEIAGTKDKRGITSQFVSIRKCSRSSFERKAAGEIKFGQNSGQSIQVGNVSQAKELLRVGKLKGNRFTIVIRDLVLRDSKSAASSSSSSSFTLPPTVDLSLFEKNGFINYFGLQRFGTNDVGTHEVGVKLLNKEFKQAVDFVLMPREGEDEGLTETRKQYAETRNAKEFFEKLPRRCTVERALADSLGRNPQNYNLALDNVPRNSMTMFLHAVQSLIWNRVASARMAAYGPNVVVGDLVRVENGGDNRSNRVTRITDPEQSQHYSIRDVIIPLPGYDVEYPSTPAVNKNTFHSYALEMNLTRGIETFSDRNSNTLHGSWLILSGTYRPLVVVPEGFIWRTVKYDGQGEDVAPLLKDDGSFPPQNECNKGSKLALLVSFSLPAGSYATMAWRELLGGAVEEHDSY